MQMIGVGQLDLAAYVLKVGRAQRALYRALRTNVHEYGSLHCTVGSPELTAAGVSLLLYQLIHAIPSSQQKAALPRLHKNPG